MFSKSCPAAVLCSPRILETSALLHTVPDPVHSSPGRRQVTCDLFVQSLELPLFRYSKAIIYFKTFHFRPNEHDRCGRGRRELSICICHVCTRYDTRLHMYAKNSLERDCCKFLQKCRFCSNIHKDGRNKRRENPTPKKTEMETEPCTLSSLLMQKLPI